MQDDKRKDLRKEFGESYNASSLGGELGLKGVRLSPSQYLGSRGIEGALQALLEIIQNSVDESAEMIAFFEEYGVSLDELGKFKIDIEIDKNDVVKITDTGRGVPADFSAKFNRPVVEVAFEEINVGGKGHGYVEEGASAYKGKTIGKHGSGAACANATSDFFYVDTYVMKDKKHYRVEWQRADKVKPLTFVEDIDGKSGTVVQFRPSNEVFQLYSEKHGEVTRFYFMDEIITILTEYSYNTQNIIFTLKYQDSDGEWHEKVMDTDDYQPPDRLKPYVKETVHHAQIEDTDYGYQMDIYIGVASTRHHFLTCNMLTLKNGTHLAAVGEELNELKKDIVTEINNRLKEEKSSIGQITQRHLDGYNIGSPLVFTSMYLSLFMDDPDYSGQSKDELRSPRIKQSLKDKFRNELNNGSLTEFKNQLVSEISRIAIIQINREESYRKDEERRKAQAEKRKRERELLKKDDPSEIKGMSEEDRNLTRAREQDLSKVILYMVEGETARDAMVGARDIQTESIYSVVERPPNVYIHEDEKLWKMKKFKELYKVLYGDKKGDYKAIVIATDRDADGILIESLLLGFIFKYFPHYLTKGRVFEFQTPKFSAKKGDERVFFNTREERQKHFEETGGTWEYVNYKGLGSIPTSVLSKLLESDTALVPINPATLKTGMFDLLRFLTDTQYKQDYVLKKYGSNELFMYKKSRKEILRYHELEYDINEIEEQFSLQHNFDDLKTQTLMERIMLDRYNQYQKDNNEDDEESMLLETNLTDDFDDVESTLEISDDIDLED